MPGPQELIVIAIVALLVFGPDRLPEVMRNAARMLARFREQSQKSIEELKRAAELEELDREVRGISRELRDATSTMDRELRGAGAEVGRTVGEATGGAAAPGPAASEPPPMDPEAT